MTKSSTRAFLNHDGESTTVEYSTIIPNGELFSDAEKQSLGYKITKHMSHRPIIVCTSMCSFILLITIITFSVITVFSPQTNYDWIIASSEESKNSDAMNAAINEVDPIDTGLVGERRQSGQSFSYIYKTVGDIYTAENILSMCKTETQLVKNAKFEDFCALDAMGNCDLSKAVSIPMYFYGFPSLANWSCTLLNESVVASKRATIYSAMDNSDSWDTFLDGGAVKRGYSVMGASYWFLGAPLAGYNSTVDRPEDQEEEYKNFVGSTGVGVGGVEEGLFTFFNIDSNEDSVLPYYPSPYRSDADAGNVEVMWSNNGLYSIEEARTINTDLLFSLFSLIFVWIWLRVHTGSTFISLMGMYMIFTSLPFSIFIYKIIYQVPYFSILHVLVIFIVLGVGADDILVLVDSWKKTRFVHPKPITNGANRDVIHRRLYDCYMHTVTTVFNTSFTTAMAFIATGLSPLMPIATFGWFAATCICVNYLFVITMMPPVVVIAECYFSQCIPSLDPSNHQIDLVQPLENGAHPDTMPEPAAPSYTEDVRDEIQDIVKNADTIQAIDVCSSDQHMKSESLEQGTVDSKYLPSAVPQNGDSEEIKIETPYVDAYLSYLLTTVDIPILGPTRVGALALVISLTVFGLIGVVYGTALQPPTEPEQWFPTDHMFTRYDKANDNLAGGKNEDYEGIIINLGIDRIIRGPKFNQFKPAHRGEVRYDDNFLLYRPACQKVIVDICGAIGDLTVDDEKLARTNTTLCFMTSYRSWAMVKYNEDTYQMNETFFYSGLEEFRNTERRQYDYNSWEQDIGFVDGELKFVRVPFVSSMTPWAALEDKIAYSDKMKDLVRDVQAYPECSSNDCDCSSLMFTSDFAFTWLPSEVGLVIGFYQGLIIAFPVSFLVLLYATGNIIVSIYAMVAVFFIVFSVLGFLKYGMDASLGVAESIAGIIIIGFSVDYTVHLGHMYNHAEDKGIHDRVSKVEFASKTIVPTIIGGAITTAGAGTFMLACQLTFFSKMAILIVATIVMSVVYSLLFLQSVLICFGPENDQGNVMVMWSKFRAYMSPILETEKAVSPEKFQAELVSTGEDEDDDKKIVALDTDQVL